MKFYHVIITTLFATLLVSTSAMAWGNNGKGSRCSVNSSQWQQEDVQQGRGQQTDNLEQMALILDLSSDQQQQLAELHAQQQNVRTQIRTEMMALQQELRNCQPGDDSEALKAKARAYADLEADQLIYRIDFNQQMMDILTPAQQEKAAQLKDVRQQRCNTANNCIDNCTDDCTVERCRPGSMRCNDVSTANRMNNSGMHGHGRYR